MIKAQEREKHYKPEPNFINVGLVMFESSNLEGNIDSTKGKLGENVMPL